MTEYSLRLAKPHCENCHHPKPASNEVPWIHEPSEVEKEATKELVHELSLAERMHQEMQNKDEEI